MFRDPGIEGPIETSGAHRITTKVLPDFRLSEVQSTFMESGPISKRVSVDRMRVLTSGTPGTPSATYERVPIRSLTGSQRRLMGRRAELLSGLSENYGIDERDQKILSDLWQEATEAVDAELFASSGRTYSWGSTYQFVESSKRSNTRTNKGKISTTT